MHHVRTLKILLHVYMYELRQSLLIEEAKLDRLFFGVEALLNLHQYFLNCLKARQKECQEDGSPNNYQITQLGDILISQVGENNFRLDRYPSYMNSVHMLVNNIFIASLWL